MHIILDGFPKNVSLVFNPLTAKSDQSDLFLLTISPLIQKLRSPELRNNHKLQKIVIVLQILLVST